MFDELFLVYGKLCDCLKIRTEVLGIFDEVCRIAAPSREIRNDDEYLARNNRDCSNDDAVVLAGVYELAGLLSAPS